MDETPNCDAEAAAHPDTTAPYAPCGFAIRLSPAESATPWADVFALPDGRRGVLLGCCAEPPQAQRRRLQLRKALQHNVDPSHFLDAVDELGASAVCAVIDATTLTYRTHGEATVVALPDQGPGSGPDGRFDLAPGATILLSTTAAPDPAALVHDGAARHPDRIADQAITLSTAPAATLVYRQPPEPMSLTLPAVASNLAISRGRLRQWLAEAGVDTQSCADVLLAVGEATANATEHAVVGASHEVRITVHAALSGNRLQLSVSDDGAWKPATVSQNHRGHGMHLMNVLADSVELSATPGGTTVAMLKELP